MSKPLPLIGVDKLYYVPITADTSSAVTYGTPVWLQGVTDIGYKVSAQNVVFDADDGAYAVAHGDGKVEVEVTVADFTPVNYAYLIGTDISATGVITEGNADAPPEVALGYRSMKSDGTYRYEWILKGQFSKPDQTSTTKGQSITAQSKVAKFTALNRVYDGDTRRWYDSDNDSAPTGLTDALLASADTGWFSSPDYAPVAPGTALSDLAASTGGSSGYISLVFSAPTGATTVTAEIEDPALGTWHTATTAAAITAASTSAVITGLTASNTYNCRLVVIGGASNGISNEDNAAAGA